MIWNLVFTNTFKKSYKNLNNNIKEKVNSILKELAESNRPELLGIRKVGKWKGVYTYEIGKNIEYFIQLTMNREL